MSFPRSQKVLVRVSPAKFNPLRSSTAQWPTQDAEGPLPPPCARNSEILQDHRKPYKESATQFPRFYPSGKPLANVPIIDSTRSAGFPEVGSFGSLLRSCSPRDAESTWWRAIRTKRVRSRMRRERQPVERARGSGSSAGHPRLEEGTRSEAAYSKSIASKGTTKKFQ